MPDPSDNPYAGFFSVNVSGDEVTFRRNGKTLATYIRLKPPPSSPRVTPRRKTVSTALAGPKLKVERAKRHIRDFETALDAFGNAHPYELIRQTDPQAQQNVYRFRVQEQLPIDLSGILGDIVHNLRAALDHLICDLIRANNMQPSGEQGFPIFGDLKRYKPGRISKIKGVKPKAERLVLRLNLTREGTPHFGICTCSMSSINTKESFR